MIRRVRRLVLAGAGLLAATFAGVLAWTFLWPMDRTPNPADVIVCLGAGMGADGTLHPPARKRVETCAALYRAGIAPRIVMTGGVRVNGGPAAGDQMADLAVTLGVPATDVIVENRAQSTLQNAIFTKVLIGTEARILLVSEAFHLPRSWVSFRWAGFDDIALHPSEKVRRAVTGTGPGLTILGREALAIWFNLVRAGAYGLGGLAGIPADDRLGWLH